MMVHDDIAEVSDIERRSYDFPWSHGVFRDCLLAGYQCIVLDRDGDVAGYGILSVAAGEAHILNLCIEPAYRSHGYGERMLDGLGGVSTNRADGATATDGTVGSWRTCCLKCTLASPGLHGEAGNWPGRMR